MSNPKIDELLTWMRGKSITEGWDALVAYDRFEANKLLTQLYIERFDKETHELPLVSGTIDLSSDKEILSGLKFSAPRLSFEEANLEGATATLTLDFIGGQILSLLEVAGVPTRINAIRQVLPLNSPQLTMQVPLQGSLNEVDGDGNVMLSLAKAEKFKANFVVGDINAELAGSYFGNIFKGLDSDQKEYPLGRLGGDNDHLKPEAFGIRTMPAPGATVKGAPNYSDGAIVLFVKVEGGSSGGYPGNGSDFMYPLPVDTDGEQYTGAVVIGSRGLMANIVRPNIEADIGHGIKLSASTSTNNAAVLTATSGGLNFEAMRVYRDTGVNENVQLIADYKFEFSNNYESAKFVAGDGAGNGAISFSWKTDFSTDYWYKWVRQTWPDKVLEGQLRCTSQAVMRIIPVLDEAGVVSFKQHSKDFTVDVIADRHLDHLTFGDHYGSDILNREIKQVVDRHFEAFLESISVPSVDTFLVRNLLFPGYNALIPAKVMLPGDLYLPGHLDPLRTSFSVTPLQQVLEAGAQHQFSTTAPITDLTWSIRGSGGDTDIGTIDAAGVYKAPASSVIPEGHKIVIVTAKGKVGGQEVMASAMVTLLTSTINVAPIFRVCAKGESITLTAEALQGVVPAWSFKEDRGGGLSTTTGNECIYTAGAWGEEDMYIDTVVVKNPSTGSVAESQILVLKGMLDELVFISEDSEPETGKVQLHICDRDGAVTPDVYDGVCKVLYGPGKVSDTGVYEVPVDATGFAVIHIKVGEKRPTNGLMVLPLPMDNVRDYTPTPSCHNVRPDRGPRKPPKTT